MKKLIFSNALSSAGVVVLLVTTLIVVTQPATSRFASPDTEEEGCLSCHLGIEIINERMQPFLLGFAQQIYGKGSGYECAICHEGNPSARSKREAHMNMIHNPSSLWVLHEGKGCSKCHDSPGSITSIMGQALEKPVGGELLSMAVSSSDPSGRTGIDYTYRMARGLMSLETGKASKILSSNGFIDKGTFPYADFTMDDSDGPVPRVGSDAYREWTSRAIEEGYQRRLEGVKEIPFFERGVEELGSEEAAGFADVHRKQCARCHVWGEGRDRRGDMRASGCAACHVLYGNDGHYEGDDKTIKNDGTRPHPLKHRITTAIPASQCTHCHTRGKRIGTTFVGMFEYDYVKDGKAPPYDENANPQEPLFTKEYLHVREDVHFERGMQCTDCHTSIEVHGDGNIYPVTYYQIEISCYDCHGTPERYPWELPVGFGTPVVLDGERGTFKSGVGEFLLTTKGNVKANWRKEGNRAYLISRYTGTEHDIPLLKEIALAGTFKTRQGQVAMEQIPQHIEKMECYACHATWAPQCYGCHMQYDRRIEGIDWIKTSKNRDPATGRQSLKREFGDLSIENRSFLRWENPILGVNYRGKVSPIVPGCQVFSTFIDGDGAVKALNRHYRTSTGQDSPTLAPLQPHSVSLVARTCENCHTDPKAIGYGTANSRSAAVLNGDHPEFQDLSHGVYGDIPGAVSAKWQVPRIPDFPFTLDQLVTRGGWQVFNMPLPEDRPLDQNQRNLVEREGLCIGCHRYYGTEEWDRIVRTYGRALTAEEHEKMVGEAIKSLMKTCR